MPVKWLRLVWRVTVALLSGAFRRLIHGPLVAGWEWGTEMRRVTLAAFIEAGIASGRPERWADFRPPPPPARRLARLVHVEQAALGGVPGEWIRPDTSDDTILYFHGGGFVVGHPDMERHFIAGIAVAARCDAYSVDYRLAPRHRFPAAIEDARAAYRALIRDVPASRVWVVGDSAGGNLAAALLVSLRDSDGPMPAGAVLFSPWLDLAGTGATLVANAATDYLPQQGKIDAGLYLGQTDPTDPLASPLYADLTGLPSLLVLAGGREMLLDDSRRFVEAAIAAGVDAQLHIAPDMYHVWPAVLPRHPASVEAVAFVGRWIDGRR